MKIFKSHFWYTKSQRNGVLFLIIIIVVLQGIYFFVDFSSDEIVDVDTPEIINFTKQIDSLRKVRIAKKVSKIYPFNPNYITDYKGYVLGMSLEEIDRLHEFRKRNQFVNSIADFKRVTKVSDTLLQKISPYFKFPEWVVSQQKNKKASFYKKKATSLSIEKKIATNDINLATAEDFKTIKGIGEKLSKRIVKYRKRLQGFSYTSQLYEVWDVDINVMKELLKVFTIKEKPIIKKININTARFKEVLKTPYVDYELCKKIFDYRDEVAELQNISELKNIESFPMDKYDRIVLYLFVE